MTLDRRKAYEIAQALLRARNKTVKGDVIEGVAHNGVAPGKRGYGEPGFERQPTPSHRLISVPPSHPFRDPSQLADLQNISSRPSEVNAFYRTEPKPAGGYYPRKAYDHPAPYSTRERAAGPTTQMGTGETGINQSLRNDSEVRPYISSRPPRRHDGKVGSIPPGHSDATSHQADGRLHTSKQAQRQENELPKVRYPTAGDIVLETLGGVGKGIVQSLAEMGTSETERRLAEVNGIHIDLPTPDLFGRPISPWDNNGRAMAPAIAVAIMPFMRGANGIRRGKRIGRVRPPRHLKPGTTPYGNYMHAEITKFIEREYSPTKFHNRIGQGQRGVDLSVVGGHKPDFDHIDIKTNKRHSERQIKRQIQNWGYDESTVKVFSYDEFGNIYEGFDY